MIIETKDGPVDSESLHCMSSRVDDEDFYGLEYSYFNTNGDLVARFRKPLFSKASPFPVVGLVETTHGPLSTDGLARKDGMVDSGNECTHWVEYYLGEELVHRSVNTKLKDQSVGTEFAKLG